MIHAKIMLLGDIGVGKSSIAKRLIFDQFDYDYKTTIGVDILSYSFKLDPSSPDNDVQFTLWDTDGDFGDEIFNSVYIKGASAAIIVADLTRPTTTDKLLQIAAKFSDQFPGRPYIAVLNKTDLVPVSKNEKLSVDLPIEKLHFTSAKDGNGVAEVFTAIAADLARRA